MKNAICLILFMIPLLGLSQDLKLDTDKATVSFVFVSSKTKGTINDISASIQLNVGELSKSVISGTAKVESLSTGVKARDKHLKSDDFFDAEKYPTMKFTSSEIVKDGDNFKAKGTLTIKDVTKQVTFTLRMDGENMIFETMIYSSDYNVSVKKGKEKNKVKIKVIVPIS